MLDVAFANIFNTEVIDNETKEDWAPFVVPESWGFWILVVTMVV